MWLSYSLFLSAIHLISCHSFEYHVRKFWLCVSFLLQPWSPDTFYLFHFFPLWTEMWAAQLTNPVLSNYFQDRYTLFFLSSCVCVLVCVTAPLLLGFFHWNGAFFLSSLSSHWLALSLGKKNLFGGIMDGVRKVLWMVDKIMGRFPCALLRLFTLHS